MHLMSIHCKHTSQVCAHLVQWNDGDTIAQLTIAEKRLGSHIRIDHDLQARNPKTCTPARVEAAQQFAHLALSYMTLVQSELANRRSDCQSAQACRAAHAMYPLAFATGLAASMYVQLCIIPWLCRHPRTAVDDFSLDLALLCCQKKQGRPQRLELALKSVLEGAAVPTWYSLPPAATSRAVVVAESCRCTSLATTPFTLPRLNPLSGSWY